MSSIIFNPIPGDFQEKLTLTGLLRTILKNNGFIDINHINSVINTLKVQINVLLNEVLGVEHDIDATHNYDDSSIKSRIEQNEQDIDYILEELTDHGGEILALVGKLIGIKSLTSSLSLFNEYSYKSSTLDNVYDQTTLQMVPVQINMQESGMEIHFTGNYR
jgi:hypothetical protein